MSERSVEVDIDEDWYLDTNPDVRDALSRGTVASVEEHYIHHGQYERRPPQPPEIQFLDPTFVFGAFGTNNVGDEAIFEGLRQEFADVVQIFQNKTTYHPAIGVTYALKYKKLFRPNGRLIIGGGGLLYSQAAVIDMLSLATSARDAGSSVEILGLGCESARVEYHGEIRQLIALADNVTVRTSTSAEILKGITGLIPRLQEDFAFRLAAAYIREERRKPRIPVIGLVTTGDVRKDLSAIASLLAPCIHKGRARFIHIPHSRAYVDRYNNDVVVGQALWSELRIDKLKDEEAFTLQPFSSDPRAVLDVYRQLDGVVSARFHGLVFGHMLGLPTLALEGQTLKNQSFIRDYQNSQLFVSYEPNDLSDVFARFLEFLSG